MGWPDKYTKKAHEEGYAARSVYKLQAIDSKFRVLSKGYKVLDLGCYPGSFSQFAAQRVGKDGLVIGLDIQKIPKKLFAPIETFVADIFSEEAEKIIEKYAPFDVIFSDMAPQTMGNRKLDQGRSAALVERAWEIAQKFGRPGAKIVIKYFQGHENIQFIKNLQKSGFKIKTYKPSASREESYEMFMIGQRN